MSKSMKFLLLAGVTSLAVASPVQAGGRVVGSDFHASAAPVCDGTVRSQGTAHDGRLFRKACPLLAGDGPPTGPGDGTSRAELSTDARQMFAGGKGGMSGEFHAKLSTQQRLAGGRGGMSGDIGNGRTAALLKGGPTDHSAALVIDPHWMMAGGRGGIGGDV